ncbi:glutamate--tRNA ligase family protein [Allokutzneria sp. A3M-2-11 16]|uniref:glutamate--tRNA ligase n=1 Tax=Allokutzneria sp. A3M-2-11 16 TaxID=2962043 RepID=UPI0020B8C882|nr:glutamate--tRNA ligase family protein [Allokutzneria sp. A3M-2-11 16]MCP3805021.1 glutamate--tRNA ligase family protein [Allokutzneria sp. A3M-2-11 16]
MLDRAVIDALFPADLPEPQHWEQQYPARELPEGALVTRFGPSPTGFVHIGGIYVATIDQDLSRRTGGRYLVRIEDTDQSREVAGALEQFGRAFDYFGLAADEDVDRGGDYGPYAQSARERIYLTYVRELLRQGRAYLDFATKDELSDITKRQQAQKVAPGYYGRWSLWRNATAEQVQAKLDAGEPYVVRFRAPDDARRRARFTDAIRGEIEAEANRNDVVVLKSSEQSPRLPTYHFAHAVDDHLMRINLVIRGDEWISSVPVHQQLFEALGFEPITYAHIAPLMKQEGSSKRKLSKRKDPEAGVDFYIEAGYPAAAVLYYLRGLANGRLAELPLEQALTEPIQLANCGVAGPLVDLVKLDALSADHIATLSGQEILDAMLVWADRFDQDLRKVLDAEPELALRGLAVERDGVENPRKDLRKWSEFREAYGFFFPQLHEAVTGVEDERITALGVDAAVVRALVRDFVDGYQQLADGSEWFDQIRGLAAKHGFARNAKEYKKDPENFPGSIREASQIIRIAITGSTRSPDLHAITQAIGQEETLRRLAPLTA